MKKSWLLLLLALILAACGAQNHDAEATAAHIANYVSGLVEVEECNVQIDGNVAVIGLNLAHEHNEAELIALKRRIVADVRAQNSEITRVAVNTAAETFENVTESPDDGHKSLEERKIEAELKENEGKDIFINVVPTF